MNFDIHGPGRPRNKGRSSFRGFSPTWLDKSLGSSRLLEIPFSFIGGTLYKMLEMEMMLLKLLVIVTAAALGGMASERKISPPLPRCNFT